MLKLITSDPEFEDARFIPEEYWEPTMPQRMHLPFLDIFVVPLNEWIAAGKPDSVSGIMVGGTMCT